MTLLFRASLSHKIKSESRIPSQVDDLKGGICEQGSLLFSVSEELEEDEVGGLIRCSELAVSLYRGEKQVGCEICLFFELATEKFKERGLGNIGFSTPELDAGIAVETWKDGVTGLCLKPTEGQLKEG